MTCPPRPRAGPARACCRIRAVLSAPIHGSAARAPRRRRWRMSPAGCAALGAGIAAVATRLPFAARRLWDHDSVQFALGVERYDLAAHHPHPPGYPLYIAVLKLLSALGVDSLDGMVALSILAAAAGAAVIVPLTA